MAVGTATFTYTEHATVNKMSIDYRIKLWHSAGNSQQDNLRRTAAVRIRARQRRYCAHEQLRHDNCRQRERGRAFWQRREPFQHRHKEHCAL